MVIVPAGSPVGSATILARGVFLDHLRIEIDRRRIIGVGVGRQGGRGNAAAVAIAVFIPGIVAGKIDLAVVVSRGLLRLGRATGVERVGCGCVGCALSHQKNGDWRG